MKAAKLAIYISFLITALPALATADPIGCPGTVDHVLIEVGRFKPYPDLIPPDVGAYGETPQQEWNYLSNKPDDVPVTVHCYPTEDRTVKTDVDIPASIRKCTLLNDRFWCE